jgi:hypothetical protein
MKRVLLFLLLSVLGLSAADFSGRWAGELRATKSEAQRPNPDTHFLVLEQNGATVTGTAGAMREAQFDIRNVKLDGSRLTFEIMIEGPGIRVAYDLVLSGDTITGTVVSKEGPVLEGTLSFKRE